MKIAMIGQKGIPTLYGGIERHVEELSIKLAEKNHDIFIYSRKWYTPKEIKEYKGVKIIHTKNLKTKHLDTITHTFTSTMHAIFKLKPDVIHYHGVGPSLLAWIPKLFSRKIKVVSTFHCIDRYHQKWGWFARTFLLLGEKASCAFPHQTISVSKTIQNYCINEYKNIPNLIPNGVSQPKNNTDNKILEELELEPQKYLVMISRLIKHKGAHYLIPAWQIALAKNPEIFADMKLVIVGGASFSDNYVAKLKLIAKNDNSIIFAGWQNGDNLDSLYQNSLMLIHPSENEGLPITVLQAMAHAKPVLVSNIPEHQEVIEDSKYWFENTNIVDLSEKITELIKDKESLEKTGLKNKKISEERYNWNIITKQTEDIYKDITLSEMEDLVPEFYTI